jgi:hypothetical protein
MIFGVATKFFAGIITSFRDAINISEVRLNKSQSSPKAAKLVAIRFGYSE